MSADLQDSIKIVTCLEDIARPHFFGESTESVERRRHTGGWNKENETANCLTGLSQKVRDLLVVGEASVGVGNAKGVMVVLCSLGPPQFTTHASIVSKLFSLPVNMRNVFISFHLVLMSQLKHVEFSAGHRQSQRGRRLL